MTLRPGFIRRHRRGRYPSKAERLVGRYRIVGANIIDPNGNKVVLRGPNYGHGENGNDDDALLYAAAGCNAARHIPRAWGTNQGLIQDGEDLTQTSLWNDNYKKTYFRKRLLACRALGIANILAFDSNCGQTERDGDARCMLGLGSAQTFWTAGGALKRQQHIARIVWFVREFPGLIDFIEPIVEPFPNATIPTGDIMLDVQLMQEEVMQAVLAVDPEMLFIIGAAPAYQSTNIQAWVRDGRVNTLTPLNGLTADWAARSNIVYTINLLDSAMSNPATLPAKIATLTSVRSTYRVPILVQQAGTQEQSEIDYVASHPGQVTPYPLMRNGLNLLNTASGGSVSWTWWEWIGPAANYPVLPAATYGIWNGDGVTRYRNEDRYAEFTRATTAARTYPA